MFQEKLFEKVKFDLDVSTKDSFKELDIDTYFAKGVRKRRFSQCRMNFTNGAWNIERLNQRPFVQPKQNNSLAGGIQRYFRSIKGDVTPFIKKAVDIIQPDTSIDWQINIHQYRVEATREISGYPVPEGPHRDGAHYILMLCAGRENVDGGETTLFDENKAIIFKEVLSEGEAIIIDDTKLFHDASPVVVEEGGSAGYRDLFAIGFMEWSLGKYGPEWELKHTGSVADQNLIKLD